MCSLFSVQLLCQIEDILHDSICQFVKVNWAKLCQDEDVLQSKSEWDVLLSEWSRTEWMIICAVSK